MYKFKLRYKNFGKIFNILFLPVKYRLSKKKNQHAFYLLKTELEIKQDNSTYFLTVKNRNTDETKKVTISVFALINKKFRLSCFSSGMSQPMGI